MKKIEILTAQNISVWMPQAGMGRRFVSFLIDWAVKIIFIIAWYFVCIEFYEIDVLNFDVGTKIMLIYASIFIPVAFYTLISEYFMNGSTIGKKIVGIKVVKIDGFEARFYDYFMRWIFMLVDVYIFYSIAGIISITTSKKGQRLGDKVAGTCVIWLREKSDLSKTILTQLADDYVPMYHSVVNLSDNDVRIIKENIERLDKKYNQELMELLCNKLIGVMGESPKNGVADLNFLRTIIKDYNYLTRNDAF
ncbi:MAG: RDD family protein [Bacteroidales bacterium]